MYFVFSDAAQLYSLLSRIRPLISVHVEPFLNPRILFLSDTRSQINHWESVEAGLMSRFFW